MRTDFERDSICFQSLTPRVKHLGLRFKIHITSESCKIKRLGFGRTEFHGFEGEEVCDDHGCTGTAHPEKVSAAGFGSITGPYG